MRVPSRSHKSARKARSRWAMSAGQRLEAALEAPEDAAQLARDLDLVRAEPGGDLPLGEPFVEAEVHDPALVLAQRRDRAAQRETSGVEPRVLRAGDGSPGARCDGLRQRLHAIRLVGVAGGEHVVL